MRDFFRLKLVLVGVLNAAGSTVSVSDNQAHMDYCQAGLAHRVCGQLRSRGCGITPRRFWRLFTPVE